MTRRMAYRLGIEYINKNIRKKKKFSVYFFIVLFYLLFLIGSQLRTVK